MEVLRQRRQAQREGLRRRQHQLRTTTAHLGVVDVLLAGGDVVDIARIVARVRIHAQRQRILDQRHVEHGVRIHPAFAARHAAAAHRNAAGNGRAVRLHRDEFQQAAQGVRAVKRALRAPQHFDPLQISRVDIRRQHAARGIDRAGAVGRVVDIRAHRGVRRVGARGDAAQRELGLARPLRHDVEARHPAGVIGKTPRALALEIAAGHRRHRHRYILQALAALVGGDHHRAQIGRRCVA